MTAINIPDQLEILQTKVNLFENYCEDNIRKFGRRPLDSDQRSLDEIRDLVKSCYDKMLINYTNINNDLEKIKREIIQLHASYPSNSGKIPDHLESVGTDLNYFKQTALIEILNKNKTLVTDHFLTIYPDADIDPGEPRVLVKKKWSSEDRLKQDTLTQYRAQYPSFREIRGDGNCFFSGFAVHFLEHLVQTKQVGAFLERLYSSSLGEKSPARNGIVNFLLELQDYPAILEARLQNNKKILPFVNFCRHIAADHMIKNQNLFEPFVVVRHPSFENYIDSKVLHMGETVEYETIVALCTALDFPITIHDIGVDKNDKGTHLGDQSKPALAALCRNSEHYFVIYSDDTVLDSALQSPALPPPFENDSSRRSVKKLVLESEKDRIMKPRDSQHIRDDIDRSKPYVSPMKKWSPEDQLKQEKLAKCRTQYSSFREIPSDENPFFSGFTVLFLERLVQTKQVETFLSYLSDKYSEEDASVYNRVRKVLLTLHQSPYMLEKILEDRTNILPFVKFFRLVAADYMRKHPDRFEQFLVEAGSFENYIKDKVLRMKVPAEYPAILALCNELDYAIAIHGITYNVNGQPTHIGDENNPVLGTLCHNEQDSLVLYSKDTVPASAVQSSTLSPFSESSFSRRSIGELVWESGDDRIIKPLDSQRIEPRLTSATPPETRLTVHCDNLPPEIITLQLRGEGPGMHNWSVGIPLKNTDENIWLWEHTELFKPFKYKIVGVKSDGALVWESGDDRIMKPRDSQRIGPRLTSATPPETTLTVHCDNLPPEIITLQLRGEGPSMNNWSVGIPLKKTDENIWLWEHTGLFKPFEYKIVGIKSDGKIVWESGDNRTMNFGKTNLIEPRL